MVGEDEADAAPKLLHYWAYIHTIFEEELKQSDIHFYCNDARGEAISILTVFDFTINQVLKVSWRSTWKPGNKSAELLVKVVKQHCLSTCSSMIRLSPVVLIRSLLSICTTRNIVPPILGYWVTCPLIVRICETSLSIPTTTSSC